MITETVPALRLPLPESGRPPQDRIYQMFQTYRDLATAPDPDALPAQMDSQHCNTLHAEIANAFAQRTREEWTVVFDGTDACVAPVLWLAEAPDHPHLAERETLLIQDVGAAGPCFAFSRTPGGVGTSAIRGTHTQAALSDWGVDDVGDLIKQGSVIQA
ncbi:CoA transferase [Streptomyces sp. NPDC001276]|uniref:CoA transferase n=1 Tax=Streptomyces sp. NPDC001276 TaxID=3364555 RepID=UPI0036CECE1B